jgi:rSAM/selenodomain-associated transferase 1
MHRLVIFTRYPVPGRSKTRLIAVLGAEGAARLQRRLTEQIVERARTLAAPSLSIQICYADGEDRSMRRWLGHQLDYRQQARGDLGSRMLAAFEQAAADGMRATVIVGSDIPALTASLIDEAFVHLAAHPLVIGPAKDGGYYLIGMRRVWPELFRGIPWSSQSVLPRTLDRARTLGLGFHLLSTLGDVDRPEDLHLARHLLESK